MRFFEIVSLNRFDWKLWLVVLGLSFLCYSTSLNGPFILDDAHTIQTNDAIKNPANFFNLWTSARYYSSSPDNWGYRPMQALFNWTSWQVGQGDTLPFHIFKVIFFSLTVMFFMLMWRELLPTVSQSVILIGGLIFLVNPVHTQVVSYIAATSTLLVGMYMSASLWQYLVFRRTRRYTHLVTSALCFFGALLSKEESIVLLGLLPLIEFFMRYNESLVAGKNRLKRWYAIGLRDFGVYAVYLAVAAVALALLIAMFEPTSNLARGSMDRWTYFITQWSAYLRYMVMYFFPYDLNADNLAFGFAESFGDLRAWGSLVLNLLLLGCAIAFVKQQPLFLFSLLWFYCAISPASSIVVLAEPVNDHRAFVAYLGWAGVLFPLIDGALVRGTQGKAILIAVLVAYSGFTIHRNITWSNNDRLWQDTIAKNPGSVRAHNNAALNFMHRSEWKKAKVLLDACLKIEPSYSYCLINRSLVGVSLGEEALAETFFKRAIQTDFTGVNARRYYAEFMFTRGRLTEALPLAEEANQYAQGKNLFVRALEIRLHLNMGHKEKARQVWEESIETFGNEPGLMALKDTL